MTAPIVIGVDLSLTGTGVASSVGWTELIGTVGITKMSLPARVGNLNALANRIFRLTHQADLVLMEGLSLGSKGGGSVERHVLWWKVMELVMGQGGAGRFVVVPPTNRAKYATGRGNAPKHEVIDAVARRFPEYETKGNENIADAIVLMAMGMDYLGYPLTQMPATHRVALDKIEWPK